LDQSPESLALIEGESSAALRSFSEIAGILSARLPWAEIEHVGSTAVSGCLTKGDLDVLVRVDREDFDRTALALDGLLVRSPCNAATEGYVEYDYLSGGVAASVQLAVAGCWHDRRFHGLKTALLSDPDALERYNALKLRFVGRDMEDYRRAKSDLVDSLLDAVAPDESGPQQRVKPGVSV
jgi:GrpB-like predicted nucleotidyltransferase (UPF0157 family)